MSSNIILAHNYLPKCLATIVREYLERFSVILYHIYAGDQETLELTNSLPYYFDKNKIEQRDDGTEYISHINPDATSHIACFTDANLIKIKIDCLYHVCISKVNGKYRIFSPTNTYEKAFIMATKISATKFGTVVSIIQLTPSGVIINIIKIN